MSIFTSLKQLYGPNKRKQLSGVDKRRARCGDLTAVGHSHTWRVWKSLRDFNKHQNKQQQQQKSPGKVTQPVFTLLVFKATKQEHFLPHYWHDVGTSSHPLNTTHDTPLTQVTAIKKQKNSQEKLVSSDRHWREATLRLIKLQHNLQRLLLTAAFIPRVRVSGHSVMNFEHAK